MMVGGCLTPFWLSVRLSNLKRDLVANKIRSILLYRLVFKRLTSAGTKRVPFPPSIFFPKTAMRLTALWSHLFVLSLFDGVDGGLPCSG